MNVIKKILRTKLLIMGLLVVMFTANAQHVSYITNHKAIATILAEKYGIPASVILAVAVVESSAGKGPTAKVLNNHFGIVGRNQYVNHRGHKSRYKQYPNVMASYMDFCELISRKRFYAKLKDNDDSRAWVKAISKCGYSELPEIWEKRILSTISANKL